MSVDIRPNVAKAVETVESHLHPQPSYDLARHPMPNGREEIWRFTPLKRMKPLLSEGITKASVDWDASRLAPFEVQQITDQQARDVAGIAPSDRVAALAVANGGSARLIEIPADTVHAEPLVLKLTGRGLDPAVFQQWILNIGRHAEVTLVVWYQGSATLAEYVNVIVGDGANVNLLFVQDWADDATHGGQVNARVGRDARLKLSQVSLGGQMVRLYQTASFEAPGGELDMYGVYFSDAGEHVEHRMFVDHNQPKTKSNVDYRGCLQGKGARSVWVGDVLIRKAAEGIETYEANKNLVLTEGCQADSVPNLEIETGEILGAGHSSTTGRFDDEQLFYLKSRGIPELEARRLVVHGFFADIVRRIGIPEVNERLLAAIEAELDQADLGEAE